MFRAKVLTVEQLENLSVGELKKSMAAAEEKNPGIQIPKNLHNDVTEEGSAAVRRGGTGLEGYVYPGASGNISEDELIVIEEEDENEEETPSKQTYQQMNSDIFYYNDKFVDSVYLKIFLSLNELYYFPKTIKIQIKSIFSRSLINFIINFFS